MNGRFSQRDAMGYVDGQNFYEYVKRSPQQLTDPSGYGQVCVDRTCAAPPPGNVIPEVQPPPLGPLPAPGTCTPADGLILNGSMHKVSGLCAINISCTPAGPVATCSFWCNFLPGECYVCNKPGQTICDCRCKKWLVISNPLPECRYMAFRRCLDWQCKPDNPFVFTGQFNQCDPSNCNEWCTNYGCSPF